MKSIEAVGIENAISRIMGTFSKDEISRNYNLIVYILQCIYEEENVESFFPTNVLEENVANRIDVLCKNKVENLKDLRVVVHRGEHKVEITGNGQFNRGEINYDINNPYKKMDAENSIKRAVKIYFGFEADVRL